MLRLPGYDRFAFRPCIDILCPNRYDSFIIIIQNHTALKEETALIPILAAVVLTWALCMPLHFYGKQKKNKVLSLVFKALPTIMAAMFAGYAALCLPASDDYAKLIFLGLCTCVFADVMLDIRFEIGGFLFFLGHVLYVLALSRYRVLSWWCLTVFVIAAAVLEIFVYRYREKVPARFILLGLHIYALALSALLAFSLPLPFLAPGSRSVLAASGAVLFVVSDMTLCYNTVQKKPTLWHYISLGIYYTAQLLLGLSAGKPF